MRMFITLLYSGCLGNRWDIPPNCRQRLAQMCNMTTYVYNYYTVLYRGILSGEETISRFCGYLQNFSPQKLGAWHPSVPQVNNL